MIMFGRKKLATIQLDPVREDGGTRNLTYDTAKPIHMRFIQWVDNELRAGRQFREENKKLRKACDILSADTERLKAHLDKTEAAIRVLNADIGQREAQIEGWRAKVGAAESAFAGVSRDAQSFLDRARKAEARAEAVEKRLAEQPLYARAAKAPEVIERKIWRVRAKAAELAALADRKDSDGLCEQAEFWRAARKLGVPVDEVAYYTLEKDVMSFYSGDYPAGSVFNTMVYEVG